MVRFGPHFGSILGPFWAPRSTQNRTKNPSKIKLQQHASTGPPREALRPPQELPRPPQDHPKSSQDHPQSPPNSPKRAQNPPERLQDRPKKPPRPSQSNPFSIVLNNTRSHQEDPRSFQDQHIRSSELLSLHTSEPLRLRVPAANCLGGIREAQTISRTFRGVMRKTKLMDSYKIGAST